MQTQRSEYLSFRRKFEPTSVKLVIVAESPPASGKYFYNPDGAVSEPLFAALMLQLGFTPTSKESGLREFQQRGWVLVDATYEPVNALDEQDRDGVITRDYHLLRDDLAAMLPDRSTPIILIKANVCLLLERKLTEDGFNVCNHGRVVYFPSTGRQKDFQRQFSEILKNGEKGCPEAPRQEAPANLIGKVRTYIQPIFDYVRTVIKNNELEDEEFFKNAELEAEKFMADQRYVATNEIGEQRYVTSNEIAGMPGRTLHEAMQEVLADNEPRSASEIASEINRLELYTRGDGQPVGGSQISARANNYPNLFVRADGKIFLA
jgi:hypothetical protein